MAETSKPANTTNNTEEISGTINKTNPFYPEGQKISTGKIKIVFIKNLLIIDEKEVPVFDGGYLYLKPIKTSYSLQEMWFYENESIDAKKFALIVDDHGFSTLKFDTSQPVYFGGSEAPKDKGEIAHEILPALFLGNSTSASTYNFLTTNGITHILTIAKSIPPRFPENFTYKIIPVVDDERENIMQYFPECNEFINNSIKNNGKVLVHCAAGVSRSATIVLAYVMQLNKWDYQKAKSYVGNIRNTIFPNEGFQNQLKWYQENGYQVVENEDLFKYTRPSAKELEQRILEAFNPR